MTGMNMEVGPEHLVEDLIERDELEGVELSVARFIVANGADDLTPLQEQIWHRIQCDYLITACEHCGEILAWEGVAQGNELCDRCSYFAHLMAKDD